MNSLGFDRIELSLSYSRVCVYHLHSSFTLFPTRYKVRGTEYRSLPFNRVHLFIHILLFFFFFFLNLKLCVRYIKTGTHVHMRASPPGRWWCNRYYTCHSISLFVYPWTKAAFIILYDRKIITGWQFNKAVKFFFLSRKVFVSSDCFFRIYIHLSA